MTHPTPEEIEAVAEAGDWAEHLARKTAFSLPVIDFGSGCAIHAMADAFRKIRASHDAEAARLREALEPFARAADIFAAEHPGWNHDGFVFSGNVYLAGLTMAMFRRAHAALSPPRAAEKRT